MSASLYRLIVRRGGLCGYERGEHARAESENGEKYELGEPSPHAVNERGQHCDRHDTNPKHQKPDDNGAALVHLFRFEGDRIAELWDIGQAVPEQSVNANGMF